MENMFGILDSASGLIAALAAAAVVYFEWRRHRKANAENDTPLALRGLSHDGRQLLGHVQSRSLTYAELSAKWWPGNPNNTNEGSIATASALEQLNETALMKAVGINSLTTFRALVQDVKSRGLVTVQDEDLWNTTHVLITDLGMAVLNNSSVVVAAFAGRADDPRALALDELLNEADVQHVAPERLIPSPVYPANSLEGEGNGQEACLHRKRGRIEGYCRKDRSSYC